MNHYLMDGIFAGMNQLLWYYADLEKQKCIEEMNDSNSELLKHLGGRKSNKVKGIAKLEDIEGGGWMVRSQGVVLIFFKASFLSLKRSMNQIISYY